MKYFKLILFLIINLYFGYSQSISFNLEVSKKDLGKNERFKAIFKVTLTNSKINDIAKFTPPNWKNFDIISGPSKYTSSILNIVNNKQETTNTISYIYILRPNKKGRLTIGAATANIGGGIYRSNPIVLNVTNEKKISKDPNDPQRIIYDNIHLLAKVSKKNPYLNEPIIVSYKLYFAINISQPNIKSPIFNNFWHKELDNRNINSYYDYYKGKRYAVLDIYNGVLIPQKVGKTKLSPYSLDITANVPTGKTDFWGSQMTESFSQIVKTRPIVINVKPLPKNQPKSFYEAVGNKFNIDVRINKTDLKVDEPFEITVSISGNGNINLLETPILNLNKDFEIYDPKYKQNIKISKDGINGKISNKYVIIPRFLGKYNIPKIEFSYFDVKKKRYITKSSKDISVDVQGNPNKTANINKGNYSLDKNNIKQDLNYINKDILFIKTNTNFISVDKKDFFGSIIFYILAFTPFIILILYFLIRYIYLSAYNTPKSVNKKISSLKKLIHSKNNHNFYEELEKILINYLSKKININKSNITKDIIEKKLNTKNIDASRTEQLIKILNLIESTRYSGLNSKSDMEEIFTEVNRLIKYLDRKL